MSENKSCEQNEKEEKQQETPDYEAKWKRAVADYRNLEMRVAKEQEEFAKFANFAFISKLLPILDDLTEATQKNTNEGAAQILKKLKSILQEAGLEEIETEGKKFDPAIMEGVAGEGKSQTLGTFSESDSEESAGQKVVAEVVRKGYTLNGRLLRAARVEVGKS